MRSLAIARTTLTLVLVSAGGSSALAWGWDYCNCYGPPYGNTDPPARYVYDHRVGPTWTGNGWAYLPVGTYHPAPPAVITPPPARYDMDVDVYRERYAPRRRHRPMK